MGEGTGVISGSGSVQSLNFGVEFTSRFRMSTMSFPASPLPSPASSLSDSPIRPAHHCSPSAHPIRISKIVVWDCVTPLRTRTALSPGDFSRWNRREANWCWPDRQRKAARARATNLWWVGVRVGVRTSEFCSLHSVRVPPVG